MVTRHATCYTQNRRGIDAHNAQIDLISLLDNSSLLCKGSGGSEGAWGTSPSWSKFFHFHAVLRKYFTKQKDSTPAAKDGTPAKDSTPSLRMAPTAKDSYPTLRWLHPKDKPPPLDRHTPLKILPSRNFVGLSTSLESWHTPLGNHGSTTEMCLRLRVCLQWRIQDFPTYYFDYSGWYFLKSGWTEKMPRIWASLPPPPFPDPPLVCVQGNQYDSQRVTVLSGPAGLLMHESR